MNGSGLMTEKKTDSTKVLTEIFSPSMNSKIDDKDILIKIVMDIAKNIEYEIPNSATFTMALDSLTKKGTILSINIKQKNPREIPETEVVPEVS